jgi:hypothetical protein
MYDSTNSRGIHATKTNGVRLPVKGKHNTMSSPDKMLNKYRYVLLNFIGIKVGRKNQLRTALIQELYEKTRAASMRQPFCIPCY